MTRVVVPAKINLALVVGETRPDGFHEVATVLQRIDLLDRLSLERDEALSVQGFSDDTLVSDALERLAAAAGVEPCWRVRIEKRIPVAAGLGGGSADAAAALVLANQILAEPLALEALTELATGVGSDVPFFLEPGPKLAEGAGERLRRLDLPQDYWLVVALPLRAAKPSTAEVYRRFDELGGGPGFEARRLALLQALEGCRRPRDFAAFPPNDLASAAGGGEIAEELRAAGAFRADVSGAGPSVYGLFSHRAQARAAARGIARRARSWVTVPVW
ncbi:MAG TPA: 4-(cytidine 5'-diphospho)-2-C-methyl-D-erythritol kinase [Gaiellaceae bacterium]|nr:4-(cytidine 5'-diphospho)-2-C-methyl-D-erythritol kinase [Gaiellaceae bacterium]